MPAWLCEIRQRYVSWPLSVEDHEPRHVYDIEKLLIHIRELRAALADACTYCTAMHGSGVGGTDPILEGLVLLDCQAPPEVTT